MTQTTFRWTFAIVALLALLWAVLTSIPAGADWPRDAFTCKSYRADLYWKAWARKHCSGYRWHRWHRHTWKRYRRPAPNPEVMAAQIRLNQLGYELEADGFTGPATKNAIEVFQEERDLEVTGVLNWETKRALEDSIEGESDDGTRARCLSETVEAMSKHSSSEANAKGSAQERWMDKVQAVRGGVFMNFNIAADVKWQCFQSQSHATFLGKAQEIGSKIIGGEGYHMLCQVWARPCAAPVVRGKE